MSYCKSCILAAIILAYAVPSYSRLLNVPADHNTIRAAIEAAQTGDTILVQPGRYHENLGVQDKDFFLTSLIETTGDPSYIDSTIIDGDTTGCVISMYRSSLHMRGFTITNGYQAGSWGGGGLRCSGRGSPLFEDLLILENRAGSKGGGIHSTEGASPRLVRCRLIGNRAGKGAAVSTYYGDMALEDCVISENRAYGGASAIYLIGVMTLDRVLINNNLTTHGGSTVIYVETMNRASNLTLNHVTIYGNRFDCDTTKTAIFLYNRDLDVHFTATNSIIWGNGCVGLRSIDWWSHQNNRRPYLYFDIDYCDIEGGFDSLQIDQGSELVWGENNLETDPMLAAPDENQYWPILQSPCRDAGDPDSPPDEDGSRADIGALTAHGLVFLSGQITCERTESPIVGAKLRGLGTLDGRQVMFETISDTNGYWNQSVFLDAESELDLRLNFAADGFPRIDTSFFIYEGDSLSIVTRMPSPSLSLIPQRLGIQIDTSSSSSNRIILRNHESSAMPWSARAVFQGDAGLPAWSQRVAIPVSAATGDTRIRGALFDGESFFAAGASSEDKNMIYRFDSGGNLQDSFPQPGSDRYGFRDLEWDGEWIWGMGEDTLYAIDRDGDVKRKIYIRNMSGGNIAFDPRTGTYWVSSITSDISAFDSYGRYLGRRLANPDLRIYGLAYYPKDPDSCSIYILNSTNDGSNLHKMNDRTGAVMQVASPPIEAFVMAGGGLYCCNNFDRVGSRVLVTVNQNVRNTVDDWIEMYQLRPNGDWIHMTPEAGVIAGGSQQNLDLEFHASSHNGEWALQTGDYPGEVVVEMEGSGISLVTSIQLSVVEANQAPEPFILHPSSLSLSSFPNPFNSSTIISYSLPKPGRYALSVVDITGREVARLGEGWREAGSYKEVLNGSRMTTGYYFIRIDNGVRVVSEPVTLIR